jgi:succinoglycan biosynthesis transport protein ExoP
MQNYSSRKDPLGNLLEILFSRKMMLAAGFFCVFGMVIVGVALMPATYEAYTSIYISAPALPQVEVPYMSEMRSRSFLSNQTRVIKSRLILEKVVRALGLQREEKQESGFKSRLKNSVMRALNFSKPESNPVEEAINSLKDSVDVYLPRDSNIVYIKARTRTAESAAGLANAIAQTYIEYTDSLLISKAKSGYDYIEKQVAEANHKLMVSESALNEFKKKEKVFSINEESSIIIQKIAELNAKYQEAVHKIEDALRQINDVDAEESAPLSPATPVKAKAFSSPEITNLTNQLEKLQNELIAVRAALRDEHPDVKILRHRIEQTQQQLEQAKAGQTVEMPPSANLQPKSPAATGLKNSEKEIEKLQFEKNYLSDQISKLKERLEELTNKQFLYEKLMRNFERDQQALKVLNSKLENASLLKANDIAQGSIRIIDEAFPPLSPLKQRQLIFLLVGFVVAVVVSVGTVLVAEYLDDSFKTPEEAKTYLDLPVLGVIPAVSRKLRRAA